MISEEMKYLKVSDADVKIIRTEMWFAPLLISFPFVISCLLIYHWFSNGLSMGSLAYDGELILGVVILVGNILFDIPFIKSLKKGIRKS